MKIPIYHNDVKLSDLVVDTLFNRRYEAYIIFRPNGSEIEVRMNDGIIVNEDDLLKIEIEYFKNEYRKMTEYSDNQEDFSKIRIVKLQSKINGKNLFNMTIYWNKGVYLHRNGSAL